MKKIVFISDCLSQPRHIKRVTSLLNAGFEVKVYGYNRGKYNVNNHDNKLFVVGDGDGTDDANRKDALSFVRNSTKTIKVGTGRATRTLGYDLNINGIELLDIIKSQLLDSLYPVGSIYTCTTDAALDSNKTCPIQVTLGGK